MRVAQMRVVSEHLCALGSIQDGASIKKELPVEYSTAHLSPASTAASIDTQPTCSVPFIEVGKSSLVAAKVSMTAKTRDSGSEKQMCSTSGLSPCQCRETKLLESARAVARLDELQYLARKFP